MRAGKVATTWGKNRKMCNCESSISRKSIVVYDGLVERVRSKGVLCQGTLDQNTQQIEGIKRAHRRSRGRLGCLNCADPLE